MLEIQGLINIVNNIEAEFKELGAVSVNNELLIAKARSAIQQAELMICLLSDNLKDLRDINKLI